jgi:hypothetical protein
MSTLETWLVIPLALALVVAVALLDAWFDRLGSGEDER